MRRAWLPIVLSAILPAVAGFADEANSGSNVDSKVISELGEKALAHLQKQYPQIEVGRFVLVSSLRSTIGLPRDVILPIRYADRNSRKRFACREADSGQLAGIVEVSKDSYTVFIHLNGEIAWVHEEHLTDKQALALASCQYPTGPDDRTLKLPKTLMGYWN